MAWISPRGFLITLYRHPSSPDVFKQGEKTFWNLKNYYLPPINFPLFKPRRFERQLRGAAIASILWSLPFWAVFAWWVIAPPQNCYSLSTYNYSTNKDYYSVYCYLSTSYFVVWALSAFLPLGILFSFTGIILLVISSSVRRNARRTNKKVLEILKSGGTQKEHRESKRGNQKPIIPHY